MRQALVLTILMSAAATVSSSPAPPREARIPAGTALLYAREIGQGPPVIVVHGGPDFDSSYFLPEMDRLADGYRLVYYDQRGRGKSADRVRPEDVSLESDVADLDRVREHYKLASPVLLGHSWGTVLALEYAIRHRDRVSRLILMNPAPASAADFQQFRNDRNQKLGTDLDRLRAAAATPGYKEGDPEAVAAYYRIHFKPAIRTEHDLDTIVARLKASFTKDGVIKARAVEDRLMNDTWLGPGYDLLPKLKSLRVPTLVIQSDHDFIPAATATHIADAIPGARLVTLTECGHFSYLECPGVVRKEIDAFFAQPGGAKR